MAWNLPRKVERSRTQLGAEPEKPSRARLRTKAHFGDAPARPPYHHTLDFRRQGRWGGGDYGTFQFQVSGRGGGGPENEVRVRFSSSALVRPSVTHGGTLRASDAGQRPSAVAGHHSDGQRPRYLPT